MFVSRSYVKSISPSLLIALIDTCARKQLYKFHLTVKIDLFEVVSYLKQVFNLQYDKSVTPTEALLYFS